MQFEVRRLLAHDRPSSSSNSRRRSSNARRSAFASCELAHAVRAVFSANKTLSCDVVTALSREAPSGWSDELANSGKSTRLPSTIDDDPLAHSPSSPLLLAEEASESKGSAAFFIPSEKNQEPKNPFPSSTLRAR